ncbi:MAG: alcohol dehydrogenase catalytic domain-containing protein [Bacteroidota bacterium]|nr:alcohol dehydrogenase catalytic domain-containing protein [Bacteroidota bacterium]
MKAMQLTGIRQMEMFEVPAPEIINDTDVLIKMTHIGVCGSDVHYYVSGKIGSQVVQYPFTVGHEGAGIVEKIGKAVTLVKPGDRIAIDPAMPCWECDQCKAGRSHTCRNLKFLGCPGQAEGCLSEYLVMPETSCFPISKELTLEEAALSEPLTIGVYAVKLSQMKPGMNIGILGSGPIGLSVLTAASVHSLGNIYVTDKLDYRLNLASKSGATWIGNPLNEDVVAEIKKAEPGMLDMVFECCGKQEAIDQAIELLKPGGKLMIIGIPEVDRYSFAIDDLRRKEICIQNVRRQNESLHDCLSLLNSQKVNIKPWATHHFKLSETKQAFDLVAAYQDGVIKAMIEI